MMLRVFVVFALLLLAAPVHAQTQDHIKYLQPLQPVIQDVLKEHADRFQAISVLQMCDEEELLAKVSAQEVTVPAIHARLLDKSRFPDLSGDEFQRSTAIVVSYISGYLNGYKSAMEARMVTPQEKEAICFTAREKASMVLFESEN